MLIYDGDCGFCTTSAMWIKRRVPAEVQVVSWQSLDDLPSFGLTIDDVSGAAWWVDDDRRTSGGHLAIGEALRTAGGGWGLAGRAMLAPPLRWLAGPIYRLIAKNRYRLPGSTDACRIDQTRS